jgi:hypothetical protein
MNKVKEIILAGQKNNYILIIPKSFYTKEAPIKNVDEVSYISDIKNDNITILSCNDPHLKLVLSFTELENYVRNEIFTLTLKIRI